MIWPAVDLQAGAVVQLVQGERCALERELEATLDWLGGFPGLQVVDLDAAKSAGENRAMVARCCCAGFRVRVGGGIRSREQAEAALALGAAQVIVGSAVYREDGFDFRFLDSLQPLGRERIVIAVDARGARIATHGWRQAAAATPLEAVRALAPWCGGFLYTSIETEGGMGGLPIAPVRELRAATALPLSVAGGIATLEEVDRLLAEGCDPVLGMALYTGAMPLAQLQARLANASATAAISAKRL